MLSTRSGKPNGCWRSVLIAFAMSLIAGAGAHGSDELVPEDECVLELDLPLGATVTIDGADFGSQDRIVWQNVEPGKQWSNRLVVRFADGERVERTLLLTTGQRVRLPLRSPREAIPGLVVQTGHTGFVRSVGLSRDGRKIVTASDDSTAILWETATGRKLRTFQGHTGWVTSVAFGPVGRHLLTGSVDGTAVLWDVSTGQQLQTFQGHSDAVYSVAFSPDGRQILTGSGDNTATLWDAQSGRQLRSFRGHTEWVFSVAFSPDGRWLVTGSLDKTGILWDASSGQSLRTLRGHEECVSSVAFSPDGATVLTGSNDNTAALWDAQSGRRLRTLRKHTGSVFSAAFSPDGRQILTGSKDNTAVLWEASSGKMLRSFQGHTSSVSSVAFGPNGRRVLTGSWDGSALLWEVPSGKKLRSFQGHASAIVSVAISPDAERVLTGSWDDTATLWEASSGQKHCTFQGHTGGVTSVSFSGNGQRIVTGSEDTTSVLWDAQSGRQLRILNGHADRVGSAEFSPDGRQVFTGSWDGSAILWDSESGLKLRTFQGHTGVVSSVAFSPDGQRVLTGSQDTTVILWNASTGQKLRTFQGHAGSVSSVAFSPDGERVLTGSWDDTAILWEASTGRSLITFHGHTGVVYSVAFTPDGQRIVTGSEDNTATLWEVSSGKKLRAFQGHTDGIRSVVVSPDGRRVLTASSDGTTRLWSIATGDELIAMLDFGDEWLATTPEGLFDGPGREKVTYRIGDGLNVVPVDRFFKDFYSPGLLSAVWRGERPMPEIAIGQAKPPTLRMVSPVSDRRVDAVLQDLVVEAIDQGGGIQPPRLSQNGTPILADVRTERDGDVLRQTFRNIRLVRGANVLEVTSASADGSWESEPVSVTLTYERPVNKPDLYVLAVGVNRYASSAMNLRFATPDSSAIANLFDERGDTLYRNVRIVKLHDEAATRKQIREALRAVAASAQPQDTLVAFLAGHGTMVGQRYYFLPHEFRAEAGAEFDGEIRRQGLPGDVLAEEMAAAPALRRILILDTCNSGGAINLTSRGRDPFAFRGAVERLNRTHGIFTIAAAAVGEEAKEIDELGHGVLTYSLLAGLRAVDRGPLVDDYLRPNNRDRVADVMGWFGYASGHVPRLMKKYFQREQDVQMSFSGESFPVLPVDAN